MAAQNHSRARVYSAVGAIFSVALLGCSLVSDSGRTQCRRDEDCASNQQSRFACESGLCVERESSGIFDCAGVDPVEANVSVSVRAQGFPVATPVAGATVLLCGNLDPDCANPMETFTADDMGLTQPVQISATDPLPFHFRALRPEQTVPTLEFTSTRVIADAASADRPLLIDVTSPGDVEPLASALGVELLDGRGHLVIDSEPCPGIDSLDADMSGIAFEVDNATEETTVLYFTSTNLPSSSLTATQRNGSALIANVAPGLVSVTGTLVSTSTEVVRVSLIVMPDAVTFAVALP